jgi:hypothetical protein
VRDQDDELVVLGAMPAAWLLPGAVTSAQRLETAQGPIDLRFEATATGGVLTWSLSPRARTPRMRWTLPTTIDGATVAGDGTLANREVTLTKPTGSLTIAWRRDAAPGPSLTATVARLQAEYKTRGLTPPQ